MKDKRITRLLKLFQMLQSGQGQNSAGLAQTCGVGQRTIFRDLETLRDAGVPFKFDAESGRYSIKRDAFVQPAGLTDDEAQAIITLAKAFKRQQRRLPFYLSVQSAAVKLERNLPPAMRTKLRRSARAIRVTGNRINSLASKTAFYGQFWQAIDTRRKVRIVYGSLTEWEQISTTIEPYLLLFNKHSWFVIGQSSIHREVRTFNLGRVESLELTDETYRIPRSFNLDHHFGNAWNMIPDAGRDSHVVVRFAPLVAKNVAEIDWHDTQRIKWLRDGSIEFHATVSGLHEIAWWILRYGDQAEVLKPSKLRELVAHRARNMAAMYDAG
jgi:predicted DNA-binding transcriptional regulator YafY